MWRRIPRVTLLPSTNFCTRQPRRICHQLRREKAVVDASRKAFSTDSKDKQVFVTTPIFYVNAAPHIGHAYSALIADVYARWHRMKNFEVLFSSGTDEHGNKVAEAARKHGKQPQEFCDSIAEEFRGMLSVMDISVDDFVRTTEDRHIKTVEWFWQRLHSRDAIKLGKHEGWYCLSDESFLTAQQVFKDENTDKMHSVESGHVVEWLSEPNYQFCTSNFREEVLKWLEHQPSPVVPKERKNEALALVRREGGLPDLSISRLKSNVDWAIQVPGDDEHSIYVWFDALINYLSVARSYEGHTAVEGLRFWPPACHVVGKDILKFHTVLWPALLAAADLPLPKKVVVHAHWTVDKSKMSKSIGNVVSPFELVSEVGLDAVRYFLLRDGGMANDGDFSRPMLVSVANKDLADIYGNLLRRSTAKLQHWPSPPDSSTQINEQELAENLQKKLESTPELVDTLYSNCEIGKAVKHVVGVLQDTNAFYAATEPWVLSKQIRKSECTSEVDRLQKELDVITYLTLDSLRVCSILLQPVVPGVAGKVLDTLGVAQDERMYEDIVPKAITDCRTLHKGEVVFQKIDSEL